MYSQQHESLPSETDLAPLKLAAHQIRSFSTGLIKIVRPSQKQEIAIPIGSGTFVSVQGIHGILTAHHVSDQLESGCSLGLTLDSKEHTYTIDFQILSPISIDRGSIDSEGPDLSFIVLPDLKVSEITPYKNFYNLSVDRKALRLTDGVWFICGVPNERTTKGVSKREHNQTFSFSLQCGGVRDLREYTIGDYDYIEADVRYNKQLDVPLSFGGVSGGGLWQVPIRKSMDGNLILGGPILSGVAFYQSEVQEDSRFIKCHGRNSLKIVHDKVSEKRS